MTYAIQKLIEWQAEDPKQREWLIYRQRELLDSCSLLRIQLTEGDVHVERAITLVQAQSAAFDVLTKGAELAVAMLALESPKQEMRHGETCEKVPHEVGKKYLHAAEDDSEYSMCGKMYCGRCHEVL